MTTVDFWPKTFLILYPSLENSTTGIAIGLNQHKSQSHHQIGGVLDKKFICDRCDTGKDILIYGRNTKPNFILWNNNLWRTPGSTFWVDFLDHDLFIILKSSSHQDLSTEGSNFFLCLLEIGPLSLLKHGHFLTNFGFWRNLASCNNLRIRQDSEFC